MKKYLAAAMLTTALIAGGAVAQTSTGSKTATADNAGTAHREGGWRASKLVGLNVYNDNNEKLGDVSDIILDKSGKADTVVLGVGGFLGMGEHYVAVAYDKLRWSNEPARSTTVSDTTSTASRPGTNVDSSGRKAGDATGRTTGTATMTAETRKADGYWYPDHAIYNATKDQLKTMPEFKY